jgi:ribose 5-phosphate isomerase B
MKIYLGADHAGFELKEKIESFLLGKNFEVEDCGAFEFDANDDYPDFISKTALRVSENPTSLGIVFGKSGSGECIVANKLKNVRAILGFSPDNVKLAREDNDANVLSLGSAFINENLAKKLTMTFLQTPFTKEVRHIRRIDKIKELENL